MLRLLALPVVMATGSIGLAAWQDSQNYLWYAIRAAGIVSYLLLTVILGLGLILTTPLAPRGERRQAAFELHRTVSLLVLAFAGFHVMALLVDRFVGFTPLEVLVPFTSDYRPLGVGLGILTFYLFLAIYLSFSVRRRIGFRLWRLLHYGGFVTFTLATYHSVLVGTDSSSIWLLAVYGTCGALVLALAVYRFIAGEGIDERQLRALETQERSTLPSETQTP